MPDRIVIAGASGFIGRYRIDTSRELAAGRGVAYGVASAQR